jgi:hypothetical protein
MAAYSGCVCPVASPPLACNDDFCGLQSEMSFPVTAGNQYLIRIGGYQGAQGDGFITISCSAPCAVNCPPGATPEDEPCGNDENGGCNSFPPALDAIECGDTICGTVWADADSRDTDWYVKTLSDSTIVTWGAVGEVPMVVIIADTNLGCGNPQVLSFAFAGACDTAEVVDTLPPGTYIFFAAPDLFNGYPCDLGPHNYTAWLEGDCCPAKGDMNGDGNLTAPDVVLLLDCVFFGNGNCDLCFADLNCNGQLNPNDVTYLLNYMYLAIPPPCL